MKNGSGTNLYSHPDWCYASDPKLYSYIADDVKAMKMAIETTSFYTCLHQGWIDDCVNKVIFNNNATIVIWRDGTKTVVKCQNGDNFDPEKGIAMAICKKIMGNKSNFNNQFRNILKKSNISDSQ